MGFEYALVHLKFTIPPALLLSLLYRPLLTRLDIYRVLFLTSIAVVYTTPWDSYLIRNQIWSYPKDVIIGPKLLNIPLEEVFFFVVQTYTTSLIYLLLSKPVFHPTYLRHEEKGDPYRFYKLMGQVPLALLFKKGLEMAAAGKGGTYMGLILVWALPVLFVLWNLSYQFLIALPLSNTILPIALPTLYLWLVDTLALRRGTWVVEGGTKLGKYLWPHLEIEEATFFLLTNALIVWGLVAFDNAVAILDAFPLLFPNATALPSPPTLIKALCMTAGAYDAERIKGFKEAVDRLSRKSRSFYLASGVFVGRLRVDLILLYSYCRVADDLVDNAKTPAEAREWIKKLRTFLDLSYQSKNPEDRDANTGKITLFVVQSFPRKAHNALLQLQTTRLSPKPLYDLLKGFEMDLEFQRQSPSGEQANSSLPVKTEDDLDRYGLYVAGTVAELCLEHCFYHFPGNTPPAERQYFIAAGGKMGIALQLTNIARDLQVDAIMDRIYLPTTWLKQEGLTPQEALMALKNKDSPEVVGSTSDKLERLRSKLLDRAFAFYEESRQAIEKLPYEVRGSMRVAVESYMEIGRTLRTKGYAVKRGRATVPLWRRLVVAWKALNQ